MEDKPDLIWAEGREPERISYWIATAPPTNQAYLAEAAEWFGLDDYDPIGIEWLWWQIVRRARYVSKIERVPSVIPILQES